MTAHDDELGTLRRRFLAAAEASRSALARAIEHGCDETLRREAHRLAGRGGMFGYPRVRDAAYDLEESVAMNAGAEEVARACEQLMRALAELEDRQIEPPNPASRF